MAGLYLSKICDQSQQQIVLRFLNKKILLPLIFYAVDLETNYYNQFDLMKIIPTAACIQVKFLDVDEYIRYIFVFQYIKLNTNDKNIII